MDHKKVVDYIENSFLDALVKQESITDVSYNGESLYYMDNQFGRRKSDIEVSKDTVRDFIRQIANICEKQFSYQNPILDVSAEKYRINAVHQSISKIENDDTITFSIRIASSSPKIKKGCGFFPAGLEELFSTLIRLKTSIVIGGTVGTGKTEFQKYLISCMSEHTRVIVIDNILELDSLPFRTSIDINVWQADERNNYSTIQQLVKNALRSNPDWLIVAESRGEEMLDVLNSSLTGHPVITTIHSYDLSTMPIRMARMALMANHLLDFDETLTDLGYHMKFYVYLKKRIADDGAIIRYISDIGFYDNNKMENIFESDGINHKYHRIPRFIEEKIDIANCSDEFIDLFLGDKR
ncbi:MAG: CpaF/VirB11 family protein [Bacilli bacterium]|nr:CpaF/VirB11 family protein [Bacilli bacterium]